jgi:hypothetical protein
MTNDDKLPIAIPLDDLRQAAEAVAGELRAFAATGKSGEIASGGGSRQRGLPEELRNRLIDVRAALFQRGIYDPVLVRFDSATAPPASNQEIAEQLTMIAGTL